MELFHTIVIYSGFEKTKLHVLDNSACVYFLVNSMPFFFALLGKSYDDFDDAFISKKQIISFKSIHFMWFPFKLKCGFFLYPSKRFSLAKLLTQNGRKHGRQCDD